MTIASVDTAEAYRRRLGQFDPHVNLVGLLHATLDALSSLRIAQQIRPYTLRTDVKESRSGLDALVRG